MRQPVALLLLLPLLLAACAVPVRTPPATPPVASPAPGGMVVPAGFRLEPVAEGLTGPTQMILGPDGRLWVAQLNGDENAGAGQVLAIDLATGARAVLLEGLLKPVGIAVAGDALWIAGRRDLRRAALLADGALGPVETVLDDLPYNGRSLGTLAVSPAGNLLFATSGTRDGNEAAAGSARLWELTTTNPAVPRELASGLKNAYALAYDGGGRLWIGEVADDPVDGQRPPDELNLFAPGADFGYLPCYGFQTPAANYGGTAERCAGTRPPVLLFPAGATPTSIAPAPWAADTLLVALWTQGQVVQVTVTEAGENATGAATPFVTGLQNPQHLLALADGSVLLSEFGTGNIYRIAPVE